MLFSFFPVQNNSKIGTYNILQLALRRQTIYKRGKAFHHGWVNTTRRKVQPILWEPQLINMHIHTEHRPWETESQHKTLTLLSAPVKTAICGGWFQFFTINLGYNPSDQLPTAPSGGTRSLITITNVVWVCTSKRFRLCVSQLRHCVHFVEFCPQN